ncbi:hypothetical protein DICVIV_05532 [Dictyocaulus viviparus]|uniref:CRAL-TRIO domain-containing protein n=1 Tax=Dictyocaulus viviparus TaxID=29172 RepID=A0A0D8Y183_DICVI|nr:hypothetical protein DICVIV_05532 [Dictyocaulus viviparus]
MFISITPLRYTLLELSAFRTLLTCVFILTFQMPLTADEHAAVERIRLAVDGKGHAYCEHDYNVYRWLTAYEWNEIEAAKALKRHLNIREIMSLTSLPSEKGENIDEEAEKYVPLTILGRNRVDDNKVLIFEQSGKIDLSGVIENVRITRFLRMKFRTMERLQQRVEQEERRLDKQSGGVLIMDLEGLEFNTTLLSVISVISLFPIYFIEMFRLDSDYSILTYEIPYNGASTTTSRTRRTTIRQAKWRCIDNGS